MWIFDFVLRILSFFLSTKIFLFRFYNLPPIKFWGFNPLKFNSCKHHQLLQHGCISSIFTQWASRQLLGAAAAFTDVTLVLKDEHHLIAHSVILSATRPFFRNSLNKNNHYHPLIYTSSPLPVVTVLP